MTPSRQFLLGLLVVSLQAGLSAAQEPAPTVVKAPPAAVVVNDPSVPMVMAGTGEAACDCECGRGWIGGVGLYLMQPYFSNNIAFGLQRITAGTGGGAPRLSDSRVDVSHHMEVAPLLWVGYLGDGGWGGRARYWYFRAGTSQTETPDTGNGVATTIYSAAPLGLSLTGGTAMTVTTKLEMQVGDLEGLQEFRLGNWDFLFAAGLRIARLTQSYNAYIARGGQNTLESGHNFFGVGPTVALEARRPISDTGLALFGSARGAVVIGSAKQGAGLPDQNSFAEDHRNRGLPIGELELGLEYGRSMGNSRIFGQVAFVGQEWFGAGGASRSSLNVAPGGMFNGAAYVGDSDLSFLGVSFRIGLNY